MKEFAVSVFWIFLSLLLASFLINGVFRLIPSLIGSFTNTVASIGSQSLSSLISASSYSSLFPAQTPSQKNFPINQIYPSQPTYFISQEPTYYQPSFPPDHYQNYPYFHGSFSPYPEQLTRWYNMRYNITNEQYFGKNNHIYGSPLFGAY